MINAVYQSSQLGTLMKAVVAFIKVISRMAFGVMEKKRERKERRS